MENFPLIQKIRAVRCIFPAALITFDCPMDITSLSIDSKRRKKKII